MLLPKIKEFTKEELLKQFEMSEIDIGFLCEYIAKRDKVYNRLIDELNFKNSGWLLCQRHSAFLFDQS